MLRLRFCGPLLFLAAMLLIAILSGCTRTEIRPAVRGISLPNVRESELPQEELRSMATMSADELIERGERSLAQNEPNLAQLYFSKALEKQPASFIALSGLGQALFTLGDSKSADLLAADALKLDPRYLPALLLKGRVERSQGSPDEAVATFKSALQHAPENSALLTELAITLERSLNRPAEAEPYYRKVVELTPKSAAALNNLGFNAILQGHFAEAASTLSDALMLEPKNSRIQGNLATAWLLKGEEQKALKLFRSSVGEAQAYNNIGFLYMSQGKLDQAEAALLKALEISPRYYARAGANLESLRAMKARKETGKKSSSDTP